jgi:hypothetical protein
MLPPYSKELFIDGFWRGQGSCEMLDAKVRISVKYSQRSFNNLRRLQLSLFRQQHL